MMKTKGIQHWRWLVKTLQAALVLGLPFIRVNGESALRFDIPSLRLYFFGTVVLMNEFFIVLIAVMFISFFIILLTVVFGRIWCGWACPQTVLTDFTRFVDRAGGKDRTDTVAAYAAMLPVSIIVSASLVWYFISPYEFFPMLYSGRLSDITGVIWVLLTAVVFLNLALLRRRFCATICPYARMQSVLFDRKTLCIAFDQARKEECINCRACLRTCPVNIDIRDGLNTACITCAECIDACAGMMDVKGKKSLIGYVFGTGNVKDGSVRHNILLSGIPTLLFLVLFVYLSLTRQPFEMSIMPNHEFPPRVSEGKHYINAYLLSIEYRGKGDIEMDLRSSLDNSRLATKPERVSIRGGERRKIPLYVIMAKGSDARPRPGAGEEISIEAAAKESGASVTKKVLFMIPEER